ncbi:uncharacterized protein ATC70_011616 [Mucor velutinosus]|uniref:Uncharacterized protein n=1 Tax=Mucor velutinosus TaxID=708070 RepID=A0AAN7DHH8_9FUNG|nr:hypothetical protein ATC70_011616 [Mucor velutinosus]
MPRTPPAIILPNNLPSAWVNRSKVNKKKSNASNIYASQKQISFDDTDEYLIIPPIHLADSTITDSNEVTSSIIAIDEMQTRTLSASVSTNQSSYANTTTQQQQKSHQEHQQQQHFQQTQQRHLSDQKNACSSSSSSVKQNALAVTPSSSHSHSKESNLMSHEQDPDVTMDELNTAFEHHKRSANDFLTPSSQQFESLVMVSRDLASDFQKFMEEYRDIKKSIEDKKKELIQYTEERLRYLTQRQTHFQKELKTLQEFI